MRLPPDLRGSYGEQDNDGPPRRTVPEKVVPGERFMEQHGCLWSVHDWAGVTCPCYGRYPGEGGGVRADPSCPVCGGTGESHLEPEEVAGGLCEDDARLLCFGGELVKACEMIVDVGRCMMFRKINADWLAREVLARHGVGDVQLLARKAQEAAEAALAKAKGD